VRLYPGDIGAVTGFATDIHARVLDTQGQPIKGLYAVGNDMHSAMGGVYLGQGITIGPGWLFAYGGGARAEEGWGFFPQAPPLIIPAGDGHGIRHQVIGKYRCRTWSRRSIARALDCQCQ